MKGRAIYPVLSLNRKNILNNTGINFSINFNRACLRNHVGLKLFGWYDFTSFPFLLFCWYIQNIFIPLDSAFFTFFLKFNLFIYTFNMLANIYILYCLEQFKSSSFSFFLIYIFIFFLFFGGGLMYLLFKKTPSFDLH